MSRRGYPGNLVVHGCLHSWTYGGVRYRIGDRISGSSAHEINYFEAYYCQRCCERKFVKLEVTHDSYHAIRFGATPMPEGAAAR